MQLIKAANKTSVYHLGPPLHVGPLPTLVYFALAGDESLLLPPYYGPIPYLRHFPMRLLSLTIPGHGEGFDKFHAIDYWATQLAAGVDVLTPFFSQAAEAINDLINQKIICPSALAFGGLSRGVLIAAHIAMRTPSVSILLGFAPMTRLSYSESFKNLEVGAFDVHQHISQLSHLKSIRLYIGNRDTLVGTDHAFHLVQDLVERGYQIRLKQEVELMIVPSLGRGGHGTSPETFESGAKWVYDRLITCHSSP